LDVDLVWLGHWLRALKLNELNKAAAVPGLNRVDVYALEIPVPPQEEQKRIAAILNEQMVAVERARAAAEAQLEAAKALPAAYLRAVFSSPEARQWPKKRLGDTSRLLPSKSIATNGDAEVKAITTACRGTSKSGKEGRGK
jgi:type I restriction enzyme S subunit